MKDVLNQIIASELRSMRSRFHYKLVDVAEKTNINKDVLCRYESGKASIPIYRLVTLLEFYECDVNIFFKQIYDRLQNEKRKET